MPVAAHPGGDARRARADVTYATTAASRAARAKKAAALRAAGEPVGDCVDCNACVAVCPTGIDIRDGQQLECIPCALCIDACDAIMGKLGRPAGLIAYDTEVEAERARRARGPVSTHRPRRAPSCMPPSWRASARIMLYALGDRTPDRASTCCTTATRCYVTLSDGAIRNGYTVRFEQQAAR